MDSPTSQPPVSTADPTGDLADFDVDEFLARMQAAGSGEVEPRKYAPMKDGRPNVRHTLKMRYSHEGMADLIMMDPSISQNALAVIFNRSKGWISTVVNSDGFQVLLARRRAETVNPEICLSLNERARAVATQSLRVISEKLAADTVSDNFALRAFETSSKALGMGGNAPPPPPPDPAQFLPELADRLMRLQGRAPPQPVSDAVIVETGEED